ncbi:hypothetical protein U9M48_003974 [Paspalum notatum var. saurae]|uniref:Ubiquitin-like protease family profile domain-containing protein n=1 Tax=Paspalum notatum var. saurae TaxID=547442 RepID=A0AAQ3PJS1_PASNO
MFFMNVFTSIAFFSYFYADICPNMKSVDRPSLNPKRITIESSQECFSVDIPRAAAPEESANPSVAGSRPRHRKRPAVCGRPPTYPPQDEDYDDDFMPPKKKPNVSVPTKQRRSSPRLSRPDGPGIKKCFKKVVTKKKKVKASPRQRINIRCIPQDVLETIAIMNQRQRQAVARKGFFDILDMTLDATGSQSHLYWLMDKLDPKDMTIRPGPGKELKITKETVRLILGLPCAGGGKPLGVDAAVAADTLRSSLGLTKDEFTVAKLQDCLGTKELRQILPLQYMDAESSYLADKRKSWQGGEPFGHCDFRSATDTCYASAHENHGLHTPLGTAATCHEDTPSCHGPSAPAPESHAPRPPPSNTKDCHADADDRRHRDFPRIKDMPSSNQVRFSSFPHWNIRNLKQSWLPMTRQLSSKLPPSNIVLPALSTNTFYEMIDDVLRAEATNNDETPQPSNDHDHAAQEPCTDSGIQLSPGTQLDTPVTGTQADKIYNRQRHMRRSFETCPDDSDTEAPVHTDRTAQHNATIQTNLEDDALAAANELMTNLNIAAQDPKVPTAAAPPTSSNQNPCNTGGSEATGDVLQPDNGPVFDETPCGHGSSVPPTTPIANIVKPTRTECALALHEFLCTSDVEIDRTVMDFSGYISTCQDVKESFADGASLDSVFMQYFIECARSDDSANLPSSNTSRLILDTNVGIMVPMLRGGHWSLYVVNTVRRCVDILDSNPYGPALGGTTWRTYHNARVVDTNGVKLPWSRLIMNRLNKALQRERPKSSIPKFGNYKIDLASNCPTMNPGSNDCGFFVTRYIQFYDFRDASILLFLDPDMSREHRSLLLDYLTFHRNNKSLPLPSDIQRFCHSDNYLAFRPL